MLLILVWAGVGSPGQIDLSLDDMALTPAETAWLEKNPVISVGGPRAFPPFHFFDDQGNVTGISADYLFSIMDALGLEVIVQKNLPWTEVLEKARSGQIDIIACAAKNGIPLIIKTKPLKKRSDVKNRFKLDNTVVIDEHTGLMWPRDAGILEFPLTWEEALAEIKEFNKSGLFG